MPTEDWSEVKKRDDDFEVVDLGGVQTRSHARFEKMNLRGEDRFDGEVESLQGLSIRSSLGARLADNSSNAVVTKVIKNSEHKIKPPNSNRNVKTDNKKPCGDATISTRSSDLKVDANDVALSRSNHQQEAKSSDITSEMKRSSYGSNEDEEDGGVDDDWMVDEMVMSTSILSETNPPSFMLLNHDEQLMVEDGPSFMELLNIDANSGVKVVSVIGNTGEGKSHTLNETFCEGRRVFRTSSRQRAATIGCWAAYDSLHQALLLDTEGMLNNNQPIRLLLKVMAISDVVIYRTRSERLHSDMFRFLGDACSLLNNHFSPLHSHPSIIISHHTQHTELLAKGSREGAGAMIQRRFEEMGLNTSHYAGVHYVATKCHHGNDDDGGDGNSSRRNNYSELLLLVKQVLSNQQLSSPRSPLEIFKVLKTLNNRYSGPMPSSSSSSSSPHHFFTCRAVCQSCQASCDQSMNHDNHPHHTTHPCTPDKVLNNTLYLCRRCHSRGSRRVVQTPPTGIASYAWSGYMLECGYCGVIYRSRQHWFGNPDPEEDAVLMVAEHVWSGESAGQQGSSIESNMGRRVVEGVAVVSDRLAAPSKYVCEWVADQINPPYWEPNHLIKSCRCCGVTFSDLICIHHCRACGRGFCEACSSKTRPVPEMRWGEVPVRVCDRCYLHQPHPPPSPHDPHAGEGDVMVRRVGEALGSTFGAVSSVLNYPFAAIKEAARPDYWVPDEETTHCAVCHRSFRNLPNNHRDNNHRDNHHRDSNHQKNNNSKSHSTNIPKSSSNGHNNTNNKNNSNNNKNNSNNNNSNDNNNNNLVQQTLVPLKLHHCRACGQGVCGECSGQMEEVPSRGWHYPVRVCDRCSHPPRLNR